jgi:periplasmic copper chaperone A
MRFAPLAAAAALLALPATAQAPTFHVSGWARATIAGQTGSAAYLSIHNAGSRADRLLAITSSVAERATLHATSTVGGVMRMRPAGAQAIAPDGTIQMKPGGLHIMLTGLRAPLKTGSRLPLTLRFQRAGLVQTSVPIQMSAPDAGHVGH